MEFIYPEGATPLDVEDIQGLKLVHISTQAQLNRAEQENIQKALLWLNKRKQENVLDIIFMKEVHKRMFSDVWKWAGSFRKSEKNIGVLVYNIQTEMKKLFDDVIAWIEHKTYSSDEIATRFHHKLVYIHPFVNGNGRHARIITDILLEKVLKEPAFTWGKEDLVSTGECRKRYIEALRKADQGNYSFLLAFVRS